jgi:hypothetical protein
MMAEVEVATVLVLPVPSVAVVSVATVLVLQVPSVATSYQLVDSAGSRCFSVGQ